jgi:hypothetical protein
MVEMGKELGEVPWWTSGGETGDVYVLGEVS